MADLAKAYRASESQTGVFVASVFILFIAALSLVVFVSPTVALAAALGAVFVAIALARPLFILYFLAVYLPFEPFLLKFVPDDVYVYARFFSEVLIYLLALSVLARIFTGKIRAKRTPIGIFFALFLLVLLSSALINIVPPTIAVLGTRQIIRFILVFFIVVHIAPKRSYMRSLTIAMFSIVLLQAVIGIAQALFGGAIDALLLPSQARVLGDIQLTSGVVQFWDPGTRVFATMGRYDQLGTFLAFFLIFAAAMVYELRGKSVPRNELWLLFIFGIPALVLTYSRSSWFGFLIAFLFIAIIMKRDKRVLAASLICAAFIGVYLLYSGIVVGKLFESPQQTVAERFLEAFSYERWRGEYYGLGRLYWIVETVGTVVPASPIFGFGPGQYGAGAASALRNSKVYESLGLPFGVYGTEGYIDNNWLSLWGESGTLGLAFYIAMFAVMFRYANRLYETSKDPFTRALALGYMGAMLAVSLNAFLATFLEVRTLAFYFWMYSGFIVVLGEGEKERARSQVPSDKSPAFAEASAWQARSKIHDQSSKIQDT